MPGHWTQALLMPGKLSSMCALMQLSGGNWWAHIFKLWDRSWNEMDLVSTYIDLLGLVSKWLETCEQITLIFGPGLEMKWIWWAQLMWMKSWGMPGNAECLINFRFNDLMIYECSGAMYQPTGGFALFLRPQASSPPSSRCPQVASFQVFYHWSTKTL